MMRTVLALVVCALTGAIGADVFSQTSESTDPIQLLVGRLDIDGYKGGIKALTQFRDRRDGTEENRTAMEWIERQLQSYRCISDRIRYTYQSATREQVFCTKSGTTASDEMYMLAAHMDGIGGGEAADDNASGTALVMELARILNMPDVQTDYSIRFMFWNGGENGSEGMRAYVQQRLDLQGKEDYPGSGNYPEPRWLGAIEHDTLLWDRGAQRKGDINIEYVTPSKFGAQSMNMAFAFRDANAKYAEYPAEVGTYAPGADASPLIDFMPFLSLRANTHSQIAAGWNPHRHMSTDVYSTYVEDDFLLGFNAAKTTLSAIGKLAGVKLKR